MKKIILKIFLLFFVFCGLSEAKEWNVIRNDSVRVFYSEGNHRMAKNTVSRASGILAELSQLLNLEFTGEANIFLAKDKKKWKALTGSHLPEWSQGVTKSESGVVYLLTNPTGEKSFMVILRHELVHVLFGQHVSPGLVPRWFEEGTAMLYSGENFSDYASVLSRANITNSLLTLDEIGQVLKFERGKANLAYAESYLGVKMIVEALGWDALGKLLQLTKQKQDWDQAFQSVLKMDQDQFEWRLFEVIQDKYKWNFLFHSDLILWIFLPILAVIVFLIVRFRKYRTYRRWEEEESTSFQDMESYEEK